MRRRTLLRLAGALPLLPIAAPRALAAPPRQLRRVRPGDPEWPGAADWQQLSRAVGGHLFKVESPFVACANPADRADCKIVLDNLRDPYFIGDQAGLTQTSGWIDAWASHPSDYAVAPRTAADAAAAVTFARRHNLRLVVKGGGHGYQGTSNAPDSLLIWPRAMSRVTLHDAFVGRSCAGRAAPVPAVSVEAGAIWMQVYDAVTTRAGRYVQGGGCATVGVAGLVQSGVFGSFSKNFGTAAAGLVEAEIVTADGAVRIANGCTNPDLFWGLKGGGGGSLGVVTRVTLRTYPLPDWFGGAFLTVKASAADAFSRLVSRFVAFYAERLWSPHWGESVAFRRDNTFTATMVWQGLEQTQAEAAWRPFLDWLAAAPQDFTIVAAPRIVAVPARHWWDAAYLREHVAGAVTGDAAGNAWWTGNQGEIGWFVHGYTSAWLPDALLAPEQQERLAETLFAASREWTVSLHFNKGLGGAPAAAVAASRDTATNPAALTAFALAIVSASGPPAYPGMPGPPPDTTAARADAAAVTRAMAVLRRLVPETAAYVSESDFFERDWQRAFWGSNYARLRAIKEKYDPDGLFIVHHGVGSEEWSDDGFTRLAAR